MQIQWQKIESAKAIRLLMNSTTQEILKPCMLSSQTIKSIAEQLSMPINAVHYHMQQLLAAQLIHISHFKTRRGRSIKHYKSTATGFFVPFVATKSDGLKSFVQQQMQPYLLEFMGLVATAGATLIQDINQVGMRIYDAGGYVHIDLSPRGQSFDFAEFLYPDAPALMSSIVPIRLGKENAKKLQLEMLELLEKYLALGGTEDYVVHIGLAPGLLKNQD